jgi:hypothetical protein
MVHKLNDQLSIILGYAQLIARDADAGDPKLEPLNEIIKAANAAGSLVRDLHKSAHDGHAQMGNPLFRMLRNLLREPSQDSRRPIPTSCRR